MPEQGLKPATSLHRGGETRALAALEALLKNKDYVATFSKPSTAPTAFSPQSTTLLSAHHHFGSLSVRLLYWRVMEILEIYPKAKQSTIPTNLIGQLLFRDMYFSAQAPLGHIFGQVHGNSRCRFIPWHLPSTISSSTGIATGSYHTDTPEAEEWLHRWKFGKTGFPWIDALMRQLRQEGWIHHLGRHAVACFLTRGGCYISWERGAEVFEEWLIDHEVACNAGNWQWLSCSAFYAQFYRCYSPIAFPKKTDPKGDFVRRFVPELAKYPDKYIYEPWNAPIADQKRAGCLIKGDGGPDSGDPLHPEIAIEEGEIQTYPKPMFDFNARRTICIDAIKNAYHVNLYGNSPKVLDGTWRALFDDAAEGPTEGKNADDVADTPMNSAERDNGAKTIKTAQEDGVDGEKGVEPDGSEAAELGGETKGGDRTAKDPVKRKRGAGQATLDAHLAASEDGTANGSGKSKRGRRR